MVLLRARGQPPVSLLFQLWFKFYYFKENKCGKAKVGEVAFIPGSDDETFAFINRFRKEYFNNDVPYSPTEGTSAIKKDKEGTEEEKKKEDDGFWSTP